MATRSPAGQFAVDRTATRMKFDLQKMIIQRYNDGTRGAMGLVSAYVEAFAQQLLDPALRMRIHEAAARAATTRVLEAYDAMQKQPSAPLYPEIRGNGGKHPRFGGTNRLREALATPGVVAEATARGVNFLPGLQALDQAAAGWRRLNYGAGGVGANTPNLNVTLPVYFDARNIGRIQLRDRPEEPFLIPWGRWINSGNHSVSWDQGRRGSDVFIPFGKKGFQHGNWYQTRGIVGKNFLYPGLVAIAEELPKGYEVFGKQTYKEVLNGQAMKTAFARAIAQFGRFPASSSERI